jgi:hypothetical protein
MTIRRFLSLERPDGSALAVDLAVYLAVDLADDLADARPEVVR